MRLPDDLNEYQRQVERKLESCCRARIWPIPLSDFQAWLHNFQEDELDYYVALRVLDSLIYRSKSMLISAYSTYLIRYIRPSLENIIGERIAINEFCSALNGSGQRRLSRYLSFSSPRVADEEGESGSTVIRMLNSNVIDPRYNKSVLEVENMVSDGGHLHIFLDDFVGSGDQFYQWFKPKEARVYKPGLHLIYAPLMGWHKGVDYLSAEFPSVDISPVELLGPRHSIIVNEDVHIEDKVSQHAQEVGSHLISMKERYGKRMPFWMGRDDAALPLAFEWGCPNQAIALLWMHHSTKQDWSQLFSRRS